MKRKKKIKKYIVILIPIILFLLICLKIDNKFNNKFLLNMINCPRKIINIIELNNATRKENIKLKKNMIDYNNLKEENIVLKKENDKLRNEIDINSKKYKNIIYSNAIERNTLYFFNSFIIDKGSNSDIKVGDPVIDDKGIVGIIESTSSSMSKVKLISNIKNISVLVRGNKDYYGIISSYKNNELIIEGLSNYDEIKVGDDVYTSNLGNFKDNLLIGKIVKIENDSYNINKILYVKPISDLNNINVVGVIHYD